MRTIDTDHPSRAAGAPIAFRDRVAPGDPEAIARLVAGTGFFSDAEVEVAASLARERIEQGAACGYAFVFAESERELLGYACHGPIPGTAASHDLYWIAVAAGTQGRGVGKALLAEVERSVAAAGGRRVYVETASREQYRATRAFYEHNGYRQEALLVDFYAPGDGKVIYVKVLPG